MSDNQHAPLWYPPSFPVEGRLPTTDWREMGVGVERSFSVSPTLRERFNAWRQVTVNGADQTASESGASEETYEPLPGDISLEEASRQQMAWLTAWRIDRYALESLKNAQFFNFAEDTHADDSAHKNAEFERNDKQAEVRIKRLESTAGWRYGMMPKPVVAPGVPASTGAACCRQRPSSGPSAILSHQTLPAHESRPPSTPTDTPPQ